MVVVDHEDQETEEILDDLHDNDVALKTSVDTTNTLATELRTDHATTKTSVDELKTLTDELHDDHAIFITLCTELELDLEAAVADITAMRAAIVGITAKLDADGGVTDTNYAATWDPAAQTSTVIAAPQVATITATKATAGPATITAAAPTAVGALNTTGATA